MADEQCRTRGAVRAGLDVLAGQGFSLLHHAKVGLITNATGVLADMRHMVDVLHADRSVNVKGIFGPEHGFRGVAQAGRSQGQYTDPATGLKVYDTYGKSGRALTSLFEQAGVDLLVFDIQDVGVRFYTYIWTLYDCLVAASLAASPIRVVVLDRPNPLGGCRVAGPLLQAPFASFVGRKPIALQHGMTVGELALLFRAEFVGFDTGGPVAEVEVVKMEGWQRSMLFQENGLIWVPPSPNMPTPTTALVYPGMGLFEGTNCSEGRGTTLPFELIGAPWMDRMVAAKLQSGDCPGAVFREAYFTPTNSKFSGKLCGGVQVHVVDPRQFDALRVSITLMLTLKQLYPKEFGWRKDGSSYWLDKLTGSSTLRTAVDNKASVDEIMAGWQEDLGWFCAQRQQYLLYGFNKK